MGSLSSSHRRGCFERRRLLAVEMLRGIVTRANGDNTTPGSRKTSLSIPPP
jgi:hypothetical protein